MAQFTAKELLIKARVQLQQTSPFFSYLVMHLQMQEDGSIPTAGVNMEGKLYYNPKYIEKLDLRTVTALLCHEVMHFTLEHLQRAGNRDKNIYNYAADLCINGMLDKNGFKLSKDWLVPDNDSYTIGKVTINNISKKTADEIYEELLKIDKKEKLPPQTDDHSRWGEGKPKEGKRKDWKKALVEAATYARQRGELPAGMERFIDGILRSKIHWKQLLYRYITNEIISDYSYNRPSKKSFSTGVYLPSVVKQNIEMAICVDTSGSIGQEELKEFLTEIVAIARSFQNVNMRVVACDAKVQADYEVRNGNIDKILALEMRGGGGTSFIRPLDYILENCPSSRLVVFFTDGEGDRVAQGDYPFNLLWVISKDGTDELIKESGVVVKIET